MNLLHGAQSPKQSVLDTPWFLHVPIGNTKQSLLDKLFSKQWLCHFSSDSEYMQASEGFYLVPKASKDQQ